MKKLCYIILSVICFAACKDASNLVEIKGELKGLSNDTVYIYGNDELSDLVDTMYVVNGKVAHTIPVDTLFHVMLILNNNQEYPLYLDKGQPITIKGDLTQSEYLDIKGVTPNEELTAFNNSIREFSVNPPDTAVINRAATFIRTYQTSPVSIYLLDKFFVQKTEPDLAKIKELISYMDGVLQDKPYIDKLTKLIEQAEKGEPGKSAISFSLPNLKKENINRTKFRNTYLLINFWASWCDSCKTTNAELRSIYNKYKDHSQFSMLGVSLDMDRDSLKNAIKTDTLQWEQVCNFMGWDSDIVKQYGVYNIPYNILLGTDGRVLERDIKGEALTNKLKELLKEEKGNKRKRK
ncbi:TlpA disulfide reductase family protein [Bacteroides sp. 519]|uniref:TlpA disulfide reductase family protein n=1 Tax=Bacteroides sp. 519 TaxID=2302937 RepID=UPI0013D4D26C|nr:TlpA disulfide reductase family protein [Bacteroides sp. 519]NDV57624.1 AhpC/TSA family protein [Bacteroides sp. 519]